MAKNHIGKIDKTLFWSFIVLIIIGLLILFSASMVVSKQKTQTKTNPKGNILYYFSHQVFFGLLPGILIALFFANVSLGFYKKIAGIFLFGTIILLVLVFTPILGFKTKGAASWIDIGGFTFQPSEIAKLALIFYFASLFEKKSQNKEIKSFRDGFLPFLTIFGIFAVLLILQPDMGTLILLGIISITMFFMAGGKLTHILTFILLGIIALLLYIQIFPHSAQRFITFLDPEKDTQGISYQLNQSLIAIGSGGILGVGIGNGIQKYNYLPEPLADTIFSVWGEEMGFIGCLFLISLYLIIGWRGFIISKRAPTKSSQLVAVGITSWITFQAFLNIMGNTGLLPFTGLPLPFVSYGGTALIVSLAGMGVLINISRTTI